MRSAAPLALVLASVAALTAAREQSALPGPESADATRLVTYAEARPIVERLAPEIAAAVAAGPESEHEPAWRAWAARRDAEIRARLERGDEDSLINLLLFGTSFTNQPRAGTGTAAFGSPGTTEGIVRRRIDDLIAGIVAPDGNERLEFGGGVLARRGIDPAAAGGREQATAYFLAEIARRADDVGRYARTLDSARAQGRGELAVRATLYRDRGLSSDTSLRPDFAVGRTLEALRGRGILGAGAVRRAAIVGPGLDFTDKAEGHDFYPPQTTQPFLVIDSLLRTGLAAAGRLTLTTIDLSSRVNGHLRNARQGAADGTGYLLVLPRRRGERWTPDLVRFWQAAGSRIGDDVRPMAPPDGVEARAVRVRPDVLRALQVSDANVVVERLASAVGGEGFDLVVATNVFVYYDLFEQSLALLNIAHMLRPGGILLSNDVLVELPTTPVRSLGHTDAVYSDGPDDRDQVVWYQRRP